MVVHGRPGPQETLASDRNRNYVLQCKRKNTCITEVQ